MIVLEIVVASIALLVLGYSMLFAASSASRHTGLLAVAGAAILVGGLVSAHMNGGRPWGFDVDVGIDRWQPETDAQAAPPTAPPPAEPVVADRDQPPKVPRISAKGFAPLA